MSSTTQSEPKKRLMRLEGILRVTILTSLICLSMSRLQLFAQTIPHVRIHGRVTDHSTGEPLHNTNVFFTNTTRGAATIILMPLQPTATGHGNVLPMCYR